MITNWFWTARSLTSYIQNVFPYPLWKALRRMGITQELRSNALWTIFFLYLQDNKNHLLLQCCLSHPLPKKSSIINLECLSPALWLKGLCSKTWRFICQVWQLRCSLAVNISVWKGMYKIMNSRKQPKSQLSLIFGIRRQTRYLDKNAHLH